MQKRASPMSPRDAKNAAQLEKLLRDLKERCLLPFVRTAARKQLFLSSPVRIALFIAASASPK